MERRVATGGLMGWTWALEVGDGGREIERFLSGFRDEIRARI